MKLGAAPPDDLVTSWRYVPASMTGPWHTVTPAAAGGSVQVKMVARTSNAMWRCSLTGPRWSAAAATTQPGHSPCEQGSANGSTGRGSNGAERNRDADR